ncbi:MAG TPA: sensor domain-containing diguanylate cyclase [Anaerolineales bacterium]|nr:sensor domain-containing diguanylate cyclase [Anaerolineales bacterium]
MARLFRKDDRRTLYRDILDKVDDPLCRFTVAGKILYGNSAFAAYNRISSHALAGVDLFDLPAFQQPEFRAALASLTPENPTFTLEFSELTNNNGLTRRVWEGRGEWDSGGSLHQVQILGRLYAEPSESEKIAARKAHQLRALHQATTALLTTLNLEELLGQILDATTSAVLAAEKGFIHLIAADTGELVLRAMLGYREGDPRIQRIRLPGEQTYIAQSVAERRPMRIPDMEAYGAEQGHEPAGAVRSAIVAPLIHRDANLGALTLQSTRLDAFTEDDLDLLVAFAATATNAIYNAQLHAEVQREAITDPLTGVYNRRGFFELSKHELERVHRFNNATALIILDIDRFKTINDRYGHPAGDQVLQEMVDVLLGALRKVDIFGRYGGDEFTALLPETDLFTAAGVAERLRKLIQDNRFRVDDKLMRITVSIGVTRITHESKELGTFIKRADAALYKAKEAGRNRVEIG